MRSAHYKAIGFLVFSIFISLFFLLKIPSVFAYDTCTGSYNCEADGRKSSCNPSGITSTCGWKWGTRYNLGQCTNTESPFDTISNTTCIDSSEACCEPGQNGCPCTGYLS